MSRSTSAPGISKVSHPDNVAMFAAPVSVASQGKDGRSTRELLEEIIDVLRQRHLDRMRELLPIGASLDAQQLLDWIAIGRQMATKGRGFMR